MKKNELLDKSMWLFTWVTLALIVFAPACLSHLWGPIVISCLLAVVLAAFAIDLHQKKGLHSGQYAALLFVVFYCIYCALIWLIVAHGLRAEWLLVEAIFLSVFYGPLVTIQKQAAVSDVQNFIGLTTITIITFARLACWPIH
ncbi:MAG: hypothetical protein K6A36_02970 [Paludibacteraceae bacterium]|nr:hypothetical protein [Paludibacteraceae bacterium]